MVLEISKHYSSYSFANVSQLYEDIARNGGRRYYFSCQSAKFKHFVAL